MFYKDARGWIARVEQMGELKNIHAGEIGAERQQALMKKWRKELFS